MKLTAEAKMVDEELAEHQLVANSSLVGSRERYRDAELRSKSEAAWQRVMDRVMALMSLTNDLREPLPDDSS